MTTATPSSAKPKLPPGSKAPAIVGMVQALLDQFGTLERYSQKYGEIFYGSKSSLMPPYVIFSNPNTNNIVSY